MATRPDTSRQDLSAFLQVMASFEAEIGAIAMTARMLIFDLVPEAYEIVWLQQKNIGYGTGPKKQTEHFAWIMPATSHVTFGFNYGAELPDPTHLLEGTGKLFRHVKLRSMEEAEHPAFRALVAAAVKHRVPKPQPFEVSKSPASKEKTRSK